MLAHHATPIDALGIRENQLQLFGELSEAAARVSRRGDQHFRVSLPGMCILIINVRPRHGRVVILSIDFLPKLPLILPKLIGNGLALCTPHMLI